MNDTQRYMITFDSSVPKEERARVMRQLDEIDVMYSVGSGNTHFDAVRGIVPQVDQIMVLWDGFGGFTGSEIYTQLPEGSMVSRM